MSKKPKITPEEWAVRKAASKERHAEKGRACARSFWASLSVEEQRAHSRKHYIAGRERQKARYRIERERTRETREAQKAERRAARAAIAAVDAGTRESRDAERRARNKATKKLWRQNNRERIKLRRWNNRERIRQRHRDYYQANIVRERARSAKYAKAHSRQNWKAKERRRKESPELRLLANLRARLKGILAPGSKNRVRTSSLTGCTRQELRSHLESKFLPGMGWHNYGSAWHMDHVKPCTSFNLTDLSQQRACFHYTNLQPLWDEINREKRDSLTYDTDYAVAMTPYPS